MDVVLLDIKCKSEAKKAYENYKHNIDNSLFKVTQNVYNIYINDMISEIKTSINKWYINLYGFSIKQYNYVEKQIITYLLIVIKYARAYYLNL